MLLNSPSSTSPSVLAVNLLISVLLRLSHLSDLFSSEKVKLQRVFLADQQVRWITSQRTEETCSPSLRRFYEMIEALFPQAPTKYTKYWRMIRKRRHNDAGCEVTTNLQHQQHDGMTLKYH